MHHTKTLSLFTLTVSLVLFAGCTAQTATNTNTNIADDNTIVEVATNTNETLVNENTNSEQGSEVDTSDWLTYTNEEYGFSFTYPNNLEIDNDSQEDGYSFTLSVVTKEKNEVTGEGNSVFTINVPDDPQTLEAEVNSYVGVDEHIIEIDGSPATQYTFYQGMEEDEIKPKKSFKTGKNQISRCVVYSCFFFGFKRRDEKFSSRSSDRK